MFYTTGLLVVLYLYVIYRAISFFRLPGHARDDDKIVGATMIASSVMFIVARIATYAMNPNAGQNISTALWVGFALLNAMFYLGLLHRMISCRTAPQRRHQSVHGAPRGLPH